MQYALFAALVAALFLISDASAGTEEQAPRPPARPEAASLRVAQATGPKVSLRPVLRPAAATVVPAQAGNKQADFESWIAGFRARALAEGISGAVYDRALRGARYDDEVISRDRSQNEFTKTIWDYLDTATSDLRIANGKKALAANRALLDRIEERFGVDKEVVVAIWGLESAYGGFRGSKPVIGSLATLAFDARRGDFFEDQLLDALRILQSGDTTPAKLKGSWAGAMGHTQFMPTSYQALAVDFTGDGRRDIWSDDPADALASTANYLAQNGWTKGMPWGVEVRLPDDFDWAEADRRNMKMPTDWAALGVVARDGKPIADHGPASVLLPAGHEGAAFLVFRNFEVIETYNTADAYVIAVGHLADRIAGGGPIQAGWPRGDRALTLDERLELQRRLTAKGFDTQGIDGRIGPLTIDAVRAFQQSVGLKPDGYASPRLLTRLR